MPVLTGYIFLGIGFGVLLYEKGYGVLWSAAMGLFIFAGSGQYVAVDLLANQASLLTAAVTTLLVNARHLFYGISVLESYAGAGVRKPYMIFALTDETYSLVTQKPTPEGMTRHQYCFLVSLLDHMYWVTGCVLGSLLGAALPVSFEGIEFVLTALFVTILTEQWLSTKNHRPALIGMGATAVCLLIFGKDVFLIPSLLVIALLLSLTDKTGRRETDEP